MVKGKGDDEIHDRRDDGRRDRGGGCPGAGELCDDGSDCRRYEG